MFIRNIGFIVKIKPFAPILIVNNTLQIYGIIFMILLWIVLGRTVSNEQSQISLAL